MSEQLSLLDYARQCRERGMSLAADAEDRDQPAFIDVAYQAILTVARRQDTVHVDDILAECTLAPHHPNAWGAVWMRAIRGGILARTGTVRSSIDPKKNAHNYPVYRSCIR